MNGLEIGKMFYTSGKEVKLNDAVTYGGSQGESFLS
jgi:hypothetical protein